MMLQVATFLFQRSRGRVVILDGRTFSRRYQTESVVRAGAGIPATVAFIECTCSDATAIARLERDHNAHRHPARNRDAALYRRVKSRAQPLVAEHHLIVNTEAPVEDIVAKILNDLERA
jgi:adenylylsulfate kinase